jgi:hypothetical protein
MMNTTLDHALQTFALPRVIKRWICISLIITTLGVMLFGSAKYAEDRNAQAHEVLFIVPKGTALLQAQGKDNIMLPKIVRLVIGEMDTLIIRNDDVFPIRVGPFKLDPGQQYRQRFRMTGQFSLVCSTIYHSEETEIVVINSDNVWARLRNSLVRDY